MAMLNNQRVNELTIYCKHSYVKLSEGHASEPFEIFELRAIRYQLCLFINFQGSSECQTMNHRWVWFSRSCFIYRTL
jgi:hypothetical protein